MFRKIKMQVLLLCCLTALAGCAEQGKNLVVTAKPETREGSFAVQSWPPAPDGPLACSLPNGVLSICQSEVAVWIETEVKPAFDQNLRAAQLCMKGGK